MILDTALHNTQQYKVRIEGKVEQSRERSSALHFSVVAIEKGAFWLPSTTVTNNNNIYIYIYIVIHRQICFVLSELISVLDSSFP